jgi:hypothetical protein
MYYQLSKIISEIQTSNFRYLKSGHSILITANTRGYFSKPQGFSEQRSVGHTALQERLYDDLVTPPAIERQLYRTGSLRLPGHHVTAAVFRTAIKKRPVYEMLFQGND